MNNRDNTKYNISVEFEKYSKKFDNVAYPSFENNNGAIALVVEDRNRTYRFSWNQVQYFTTEPVNR